MSLCLPQRRPATKLPKVHRHRPRSQPRRMSWRSIKPGWPIDSNGSKKFSANWPSYRRRSDPNRARLLRQAIAQSREQDINVRFESIVKLLEDERLSAATNNQIGAGQGAGRSVGAAA